MAEGGLQDALEGGFFRLLRRARLAPAAHREAARDQRRPAAATILEAGQLLQRADFLRVGARTADALLTLFRDERAGLLHASLADDDEYYAQDAAGRRTRRAPRRDGRFLADANARAVSALLKAGAGAAPAGPDRGRAGRGRQPARADCGARATAWTTTTTARAAACPACWRDQAETARMLLHVLQYTDDRRFAPALEDLLEVLVARHVAPTGELADRDETGAPPRAHRREAAILDWRVAAEALLRAALYTGRSSFADLARRALEVHSQDFRRYGYAMAAYGRAVELVLRPPLHVVVVGRS
jgi:uncharacterized protein YyaL (SSP411 family)